MHEGYVDGICGRGQSDARIESRIESCESAPRDHICSCGWGSAEVVNEERVPSDRPRIGVGRSWKTGQVEAVLLFARADDQSFDRTGDAAVDRPLARIEKQSV